MRIQIEEQCPICEGEGTSWNDYDPKVVDRDSPCQYCKGIGSNPTGFGEEILNMVRRHLKSMLQEIKGDSEASLIAATKTLHDMGVLLDAKELREIAGIPPDSSGEA